MEVSSIVQPRQCFSRQRRLVLAIENMQERIKKALAELFDEDVAEAAELENLGGHASLRIYWRVRLPEEVDSARDEHSLMAMVLPQSDEALASEEGMPADAERPGELPFVNVHRYLSSLGMPVPDIDLVDMDLGVLLLEDLGDQTFEESVLDLGRRDDLTGQAQRDAFLDLYREAIDLLVDFQQAVLRSMIDQDVAVNDDCIAFERSFDEELLRWELDHYMEWGLEGRLEGEDAERFHGRKDDLAACFDEVVDRLLDVQKTLVLRDYQSRNLMHKSSESTQGGWQIIDFQDALKGPFIYDLVALLRDSYIELESNTVDTLLNYYIERGERAALPWCADQDEVYEAFHLQTIQRKLKDAGRFVYIDRVKGNASFLKYYDSSIRYVKEALEKVPGWDELAEILSEVEPAWEPQKPTN
jgi:aminoglycoside/choline kinase family phosphotransferase